MPTLTAKIPNLHVLKRLPENQYFDDRVARTREPLAAKRQRMQPTA